MGRKKTKKKKIKMKGGVDVRELLKNALKSGGLISVGIKPLQTNEYTKLSGYLDTIEADTYNSDEYWILRALTLGLSNVNRYINTRNKTYFEIERILQDDEYFNSELKGILVAWNDSIKDTDVDPWQKWIEISKKKYEQMKNDYKENTSFKKFIFLKTGIDNIDTLWDRVNEDYYCENNILNLLNEWNSLQDESSIVLLRRDDEKQKANQYLQEIEQCYGLKNTSDDSEKTSELTRCISIGLDPKKKPTFPTTGCPAPRAVPTAGQWDREIDELAQRFVDSINSENIELLYEIFNSKDNPKYDQHIIDENLAKIRNQKDSSGERERDRDREYDDDIMNTDGGGKKKKKFKKKKKSKKKKKTKKRKKSKKRR